MVKFVSDTRDARETPVIVALVLAALFFGCAMTVLVYSVPFFIFNASPWPGRNLGMFWGWFGWMPAMGVAPLSAIYVIVYCLSGAGKRKPALRAFVRAAVHVMVVLALLPGLACWLLIGDVR